jgi:hypothetical protein
MHLEIKIFSKIYEKARNGFKNNVLLVIRGCFDNEVNFILEKIWIITSQLITHNCTATKKLSKKF